MPCMGPDLTAARKHGREVGEELLAQLIKQHNLLDLDDSEYKKMIRLPGSEKRWTKSKAEFIRAVEELFVEDACNGF